MAESTLGVYEIFVDDLERRANTENLLAPAGEYIENAVSSRYGCLSLFVCDFTATVVARGTGFGGVRSVTNFRLNVGVYLDAMSRSFN